MKSPQEYIDLMDQFMATNHKAVKIDGANKEDIACLKMVAFLKKLPVEFLTSKGLVAIRRTDVGI